MLEYLIKFLYDNKKTRNNQETDKHLMETCIKTRLLYLTETYSHLSKLISNRLNNIDKMNEEDLENKLLELKIIINSVKNFDTDRHLNDLKDAYIKSRNNLSVAIVPIAAQPYELIQTYTQNPIN